MELIQKILFCISSFKTKSKGKRGKEKTTSPFPYRRKVSVSGGESRDRHDVLFPSLSIFSGGISS